MAQAANEPLCALRAPLGVKVFRLIEEVAARKGRVRTRIDDRDTGGGQMRREGRISACKSGAVRVVG